MTVGTKLLITVIVSAVAALIGFTVYMTVTHQTGFDDRQRMLNACHGRGLDMVQNYSNDWVCVRSERP